MVFATAPAASARLLACSFARPASWRSLALRRRSYSARSPQRVSRVSALVGGRQNGLLQNHRVPPDPYGPCEPASMTPPQCLHVRGPLPFTRVVGDVVKQADRNGLTPTNIAYARSLTELIHTGEDGSATHPCSCTADDPT